MNPGTIVVVRKGNRTLPARFKRVYIGRPSVLGNPYFMHSEEEREHVIESFRQYIEGNANAMTEIKYLRALHQAGVDLALECFCAPKACHGDVIKELLERHS